MTVAVQPIPVGTRLIDTTATISPNVAPAIRRAGIDGVMRYFEALSTPEVAGILGAGLGLCLVGYSRPEGWLASAEEGHADAAHAIEKTRALSLPLVDLVQWCDLEGCPSLPVDVLAYLEAFGADIAAAGAIAGLYVGANQPLKGRQLFAVSPIKRYMRSMSRVPEPDCGWCLVQVPPETTLYGLPVDYSMACQDWLGRSATWLVAT